LYIRIIPHYIFDVNEFSVLNTHRDLLILEKDYAIIIANKPGQDCLRL